jgi:ribokinase
MARPRAISVQKGLAEIAKRLQSVAMGRVIVVGSVNVDFIVRVGELPAPGETVTGGRFVRQGGGKGANQAVAAARAGATVTLIAAVGDDDLGRDALAELAADGVDASRCVPIAGAHTGVALIVVDAHGENQIAVGSGANELLDAAAVEVALNGLEAAAVEVALNGIEPSPDDVLLAGFEVPDAAVVAALRWASGRGMRTIANPAPARPLGDELVALHPILTPNQREAATLTGEADPERAAIALHRRTEAVVVVTLGEDGALVVDGPLDARNVTRYPALHVEVVDATGAGDALNGILAAELARGAELGDALRSATAGAALSTRAVGARAGLPTRSEIAAALDP